MGRHVNKFLALMIHSYYLSRKDHFFHCVCYKCERLTNLMNELDKNNFYTSNLKQKSGLLYFITSLILKLPFFQFLFKMVKQIKVKFFQESEFAKVPTQAT